jgi:uncharacterized protein (TIGR03083 family)
MEPNCVAYRNTVLSVTTLLADHDVPEDMTVPSCPDWTVRNLLGHLVGICSFAIGRMSGWAEAEESSAALGLDGLLAEWSRMGEQAERALQATGGRRGSLMVMDAFTHELDLRYAVNATLPVEPPAFSRAFEVLLTGFSAAVTAHNLPAVLIAVDGQEFRAGQGEPVATLSGDRYDIYRSLAGRRTHEQITQLDWSNDSHRWLPAFSWGPFDPPLQPVENLVAVS